MGLFGGDSSSKQTASQSTTGSQTQAGDASTSSVTGNSRSNIDISIVETDFGSVKGGLGLARNALYRNQQALSAAFDFGGESLEFAEGARKDSYKFTVGARKDSYKFAENTQERAFDLFDATLDSINQSSSDAIQQVAAFAEQSAANPDGKLEKITLFGLVAAVALVLGPSLIAQVK